MRPIAPVDSDIRMSTSARVRLRPIRSPKRAKTIPPSGRVITGRANTPNVASNAAVGSSPGKKTVEMVTAMNP
jgi:hypothetical protein